MGSNPVLRQGGNVQGLVPLTRRWLGFEDAHITFEADHPGATTGGFVSRILIDPAALCGPPLTALSGRWSVARGLVLTAIVL